MLPSPVVEFQYGIVFRAPDPPTVPVGVDHVQAPDP